MKTTEAFKLLEIATRALMEKCDNLRAERDEARKLYKDLIFQVSNKIPDQTRHDTARRYIHDAEHQDNRPECAADSVPPNAH